MIRVLVAEDVRILRETLVAVLGMEHDIQVVAQVGSGDRIVPAALEHGPDVAIIDIELPMLDGLAAAAELRRVLPACRALVLTGLGRPGQLRRAMAAQVAGFVVKDAPVSELIEAVRAVADGRRVIDPQLAVATVESGVNPLSEREIEVLGRHATGASAAEIAAELSLSYGTVRNYLAAAVTKLGARNRVDAARIAAELGWL